MKSDTDRSSVTLVGHPYALIGMGEHVRSTYRAMRSAAIRPGVVDIYGLNRPDADIRSEIGPDIRSELGAISIFHINGDEVARSASYLHPRSARVKYKVIYPAWELARYPEEWARQLDTFDEIWAMSRFIEDALFNACKRPVIYMPLACEVSMSSFLGRRYFGIPEADYVFLFFFDLRSYDTRKNSKAVIEAFRKVTIARPKAKCRLLLKINSPDHQPSVLESLRERIDDLQEQITVIDRIMTNNEISNLVRCCDSFVSLHRSEGYGRGMAEAMYLGKPVIATAYSGNVDFMPDDATLLVKYELIPVPKGAYPHWQDQVWADPDVGHAASYMMKLIDDPEFGRQLGQRARQHVRANFGYRTLGLRYRDRLDALSDEIYR